MPLPGRCAARRACPPPPRRARLWTRTARLARGHAPRGVSRRAPLPGRCGTRCLQIGTARAAARPPRRAPPPPPARLRAVKRTGKRGRRRVAHAGGVTRERERRSVCVRQLRAKWRRRDASRCAAPRCAPVNVRLARKEGATTTPLTSKWLFASGAPDGFRSGHTSALVAAAAAAGLSASPGAAAAVVPAARPRRAHRPRLRCDGQTPRVRRVREVRAAAGECAPG
jgi:hypothetical protein